VIDIKPNLSQIRRLETAISGTKRNLQREMKIAVRSTAKKGKAMVNAAVRKELAVTKAEVDKHLKVRMQLNNQTPSAQVALSKSARLPLKAFKPRQTKKGVSYKISKRRKRDLRKSAFMGPRPGEIAPKLHGHVFKRQGPSRLPIVKLHGASPWGAFKKQRMRRPTRKEIRVYFGKQIERRIRAAIISKKGSV